MTLAVNLPQINASCVTTASRYFHTHTESRTGVMISHTHGGWNDIIILGLKMKKIQVGELKELVQDYRISKCGVNGGDVDLLIPWG